MICKKYQFVFVKNVTLKSIIKHLCQKQSLKFNHILIGPKASLYIYIAIGAKYYFELNYITTG